MKQILINLFILIAFCNIAMAQETSAGLILPIDENNNGLCCMQLPEKGFDVYDAPNGQKIGLLTVIPDDASTQEEYYEAFFKENQTHEKSKISNTQLYMSSYEVFSVSYFEKKEGYVRILNETVSSWIKETDIAANKYNIVSWQDFFVANTGKVLGYYAKEELALKAKPSTKSKSIAMLNGDLYEIIPLNTHKGRWTKVKVRKHTTGPCGEDDRVEYEKEGWIEILTEEKSPTIFYYVKGC